VVVAVLARVDAAFVPDIVLVHVAGLAWAAAFTGFVLVYGPLLARVRRA
jgi:uncharacterized protein involved in response to NO